MFCSSQGSADSDAYFSESSDDAEYLEALDCIEHLNSPEKPKPINPSSSRTPASRGASSSSSMHTETPSKPQAVRTATSSVKRFNLISQTMASMKLAKPSGKASEAMPPPDPVKKKLFSDKSGKGKSPTKIVIIESSDEENSDTDRNEVSALLTDTDMSSAYGDSMFDIKSPTTSMSSIYSLAAAGSDLSIQSASSFASTSSLSKKRDADSRPSVGSPSKYRKLEDRNSHTRTSSHRARGKESSRPLKVPPTMPPIVVDDVFSTPARPLDPSLRTRTPDSSRQQPTRDKPTFIYVEGDAPSPPVVRLSKRPPANENPSSPNLTHSTIRPKSPPIYVSDDDEVFSHPVMPPRTPSRAKQAPPRPPHTAPLESRDFVTEFQNGHIGIDLNPSIIAYDRRIQSLLDKAEISWAVQYELARGISLGLWDWGQVESKLSKLKGTSAAVAYRVKNIILDRPLQGTPDLTLWQEFDREQLAILENRERGLGLMGEWQGEANWYGGQIQQIARIVKGEDGYKIQLDPPEKRRSHRLARYLGSRRIIQLRVPDELVLQERQSVNEYLSQKFILCGRVFVPLHAKDSSAYLVETNEEWEGRQPGLWCGDQYRKSFAEIVAWHNPLDLNRKQPISKWTTRFALTLSNSIPILLFDEDSIFLIDDIYALGWKKVGKAPAEKTMTDGCGLINAAAARLIATRMGLSVRMTAIQGRLFGGKGLWIIHPTDDDPEPKIWIRNSQSKIVYNYPLDRAHRIFDLLSVSQPSMSTNLSRQSIVNLAYNGVPHEVLVTLMVDGLTDEVKPLMEWDRPQAMLALWNTINKLGNVSGTRLQRSAAGLSRALGLTGREWGHDDVGMTDQDAALKEALEEVAKPMHTGRSEYSGLPLGMHETALEMIQSGFRPEKASFLRDKLRYITKEKITSTVEKYQIPLPQSLTAFVVPDPLGILEEGQVYYRSSQAMINPDTQTAFNVITGDVLLGRYPVRLPSDIQKVKAVDVPELLDWPDVIIVSTKGNFSPASLLSGGDYDGDELFIIREAALVEPFKNQPLTEMPANLQKDNFEGQVESVDAFTKRAMLLSPQEAQTAFQQVLLLGLNDSKVGLYSMFHDYAVFKHGYADRKAIRLAYMFNILLDSGKTGLRLKPGIFEKDRGKFTHTIPPPPVSSPPSTKPFILHSLERAGTAAGHELLCKYDEISGVRNHTVADSDLKAPYNLASAHALKVSQELGMGAFLDELSLIRKHVDAAYEAFQAACAKSDGPSPQKKQKKPRREKKDSMLAAAQLYAQDIPGVLLIRNIEEVKASYAYHRSSGTFAFNVAFRQVCDIKAHADSRGVAPSTRPFDEAKAITAQFQRFLKRNDDDKM